MLRIWVIKGFCFSPSGKQPLGAGTGGCLAAERMQTSGSDSRVSRRYTLSDNRACLPRGCFLWEQRGFLAAGLDLALFLETTSSRNMPRWWRERSATLPWPLESGSCCSWAAGSGGVLMGERRAVWPQTEKAASRPRKGVGCGQCSVPSSAGVEAN